MPPEQQPSADRIRSEQDRIDKVDKTVDAKVDAGNEEVTKKLTDIYIKKVDDFDARMRSTRAKIEVHREARSPEWQTLETTVDDAETKLANALAAVRDEHVRDLPKAEAFSQQIDAFLKTVEDQGQKTETASDAKKEKNEAQTNAVMLDALSRIGAKPEQVKNVMRDAPKHYSVKQITDVLTRLELLSKLDPARKMVWFGTFIDTNLVLNQLSKGTLEATPTAMLLTDAPERKVREEWQNAERKVRTFDEQIREMMKGETNDLKAANQRTLKGEKEADVDASVRAVEKWQKMIEKTQQESMPWRIYAAKMNVLAINLDIAEAKNAGRQEEADRITLKAFEQFGPELKKMDPKLEAAVKPALERMRTAGQLTGFEKQFFDGKQGDPAALKTAVAAQSAVDVRVDYLDQIAYKNANDKRAFSVKKEKYDVRAGQLWTLETASGKTIRNVRIDGSATELMEKPEPRGYTLAIDPTTELKDGMSLNVNMFRYVNIEEGKLVIRSAREDVRVRESTKEMDTQLTLPSATAGEQSPLLTKKARFQYKRQLENRSGVRIGEMVPARENPPGFVALNEDVSAFTTDILMPDGNTYRVQLSPDAKKAVENVPGGSSVVILGNMKAAFSFGRTQAPLLQASDIGYADRDGNVKRSDGTAVDTSKERNGASIERQISSRRAFSIEPEKGTRFENVWILHAPEGRTYRNVRISGAALDYIQASDAPKDGMLTIDPEAKLSDGMTLTVADLRYVKAGPDGTMSVKNASPDAQRSELTGRLSKTYVAYETESSVPAKELRRESAEQSTDVLRTLERNPAVLNMRRIASTFQRPMQQLQETLAAGTQGTKRASLVDFARNQAKPLLEILERDETMATLNETKAQLEILKKVRTGIAGGPEDAKIQAQIDALTGMVQMIESGTVKDILTTILQSKSFDADDWKKFFLNDAPRIAGLIAGAALATAIVIASFGTATPLIALAAAGAAGGMIGYQSAAEAVYYGNQLFDSRVRSGEMYYRERSLLGQYLSTGKMVDPETGLEIPMDFLKDVASPYLKEFAVSFAMGFATMGAGKIAGQYIATYLAKAGTGKAVDEAAIAILARQTDAIKASHAQLVQSGMKKVGDSLVKQGLEKSLFVLKETGKGTALGAVDTGIGSGLDHIDHRLGAVFYFARAAQGSFRETRLHRGVAQRVHLENASVEGNTLRIPCEGERTVLLEGLAKNLERNGYAKPAIEGDGMSVTLPNGETFKIVLEMPVAAAASADGSPKVLTRPAEEVAPKIRSLKKDLGIKLWDSKATQREKLLKNLELNDIFIVEGAEGLHIDNGNTRYQYAKQLGIPDSEIPVNVAGKGKMTLAECKALYSVDVEPAAPTQLKPAGQATANTERKGAPTQVADPPTVLERPNRAPAQADEAAAAPQPKPAIPATVNLGPKKAGTEAQPQSAKTPRGIPEHIEIKMAEVADHLIKNGSVPMEEFRRYEVQLEESLGGALQRFDGKESFDGVLSFLKNANDIKDLGFRLRFLEEPPNGKSAADFERAYGQAHGEQVRKNTPREAEPVRNSNRQVPLPPAGTDPLLYQRQQEGLLPEGRLRKIGEGGLGVAAVLERVNRVTQQVRERVVKFLKDMRTPEDVESMRREAQVLRKLKKGYLIEVDGHPVAIMKLYKGVDADEFHYEMAELRQTRPDAWEQMMLRMESEVAADIGAMHDKGVVHRDLKPRNIRVTPEGTVTIDFGMATIKNDPEYAAYDKARFGDTVGGTPAYMAPEQGRSMEKAGPPADVYALGLTFFEGRTGKLLFEADSPMAVMIKHTETSNTDRRKIIGEAFGVNDVSKDPMANLINWMVNVNPQERPTMREVRGELARMKNNRAQQKLDIVMRSLSAKKTIEGSDFQNAARGYIEMKDQNGMILLQFYPKEGLIVLTNGTEVPIVEGKLGPQAERLNLSAEHLQELQAMIDRQSPPEGKKPQLQTADR